MRQRKHEQPTGTAGVRPSVELRRQPNEVGVQRHGVDGERKGREVD